MTTYHASEQTHASHRIGVPSHYVHHAPPPPSTASAPAMTTGVAVPAHASSVAAATAVPSGATTSAGHSTEQENPLQACQTLTRELRAAVQSTVTCLSTGLNGLCKQSGKTDDEQRDTGDCTVVATKSADSEAKVKLLTEMKGKLRDLFDRYDVLEKTTEQLTAPRLTGRLLRPTAERFLHETVVDASRAKLYGDLMESFNWLDMASNYAFCSTQFSRKFLKPGQRQPQSLKKYLEMYHDGLTKQYPHVEIKLVNSFNENATLLITVRHFPLFSSQASLEVDRTTLQKQAVVFKALLLVNGIMVEWVQLKGPTESFTNDHGEINLTRQSRHLVFQRFSAHLNGTYLNGYLMSNPQSYLALIRLLAVSANMFSQTCRVCRRVLKDGLPPYLCIDTGVDRSWMHEHCR